MLDPSTYVARLDALAGRLGADEASLITPGAGLRYLTGYDALPLERMTCLVITQSDRFLIVPRLERPSAQSSGVGSLGVTLVAWDETDDPIALLAQRLGAPSTLWLDNDMVAAKVLGVADAFPSATLALAGTHLDALRMVKSSAEIDALREAGAAIDAVHARMGEWLRAGRTEREVGRDIADAIIASGHARVDFVIVASGPHGASPHHEIGDRVIEAGDPVVVDIGGTMPSGYCSDSTRVYAIGTPDSDYLAAYEVLHRAQQAAVVAARPGITAAELDAVAREVLTEAGLGEAFVHRTGHGIGLSTHEEPYIVAGNHLALEAGMAFSIEPGFYIDGRWGARIEDIVILHADGAESVNHQPHELVIL